MMKYKVLLAHAKNPDLDGNGYWSQIDRPRWRRWYWVESLRDASRICQNYIHEFDLGSGNWVGGEIRDENNQKVGQVSYNGRIWDTKGGELKW